MEEKIEGNIYQKLIRIQAKVNGLKKDKKSFGFDYVSGDKLLSFIKPLMTEEGLLLKQEIISIDNTRQDYKTAKGKEVNEILTKVMMRFTWVDSATGQKDENLFGANGQNGWDKGVGSALTYAERYFILKYFHIATDQDDIDQPTQILWLTDDQLKIALESGVKGIESTIRSFTTDTQKMTQDQVEELEKQLELLKLA